MIEHKADCYETLFDSEMFPLQGKAKWDAWNGKKGMEQVKKTAATQRNVMTMVSLKASIDLLTMFRRRRRRSMWRLSLS